METANYRYILYARRMALLVFISALFWTTVSMILLVHLFQTFWKASLRVTLILVFFIVVLYPFLSFLIFFNQLHRYLTLCQMIYSLIFKFIL